MDQQVCEDDVITMELLLDARFNLPAWYAERRAHVMSVVLENNHLWMRSPPMGKVLECGILQTLQRTQQLYSRDESDISVDERWRIFSESDLFRIWD